MDTHNNRRQRMHDFAAYSRYLEQAVNFHGHLCAGQIIGVRMAMLGLQLIGIDNPQGTGRKQLIVYVEIDRCATDAIMIVTGTRVGRRSLKLIDNGKMAATFVNPVTGVAYRIFSLTEARDIAQTRYPDLSSKEAQIRAYPYMEDEELFQVQPVVINIPVSDLPSRPSRKVRCERCGELVQDCRDVCKDGHVLCRPCATGQTYWQPLTPEHSQLFKEAV